MKNRNIIMRRLERTEGEIEKLYFYLQRGGTEEQVKDSLLQMRESLDDAKAFIQQEPYSPGEINQ
jgi:hypothetical protein